MSTIQRIARSIAPGATTRSKTMRAPGIPTKVSRRDRRTTSKIASAIAAGEGIGAIGRTCRPTKFAAITASHHW